MIKLNKRPKPQILIDKGTKWTTDLMRLINAGQPVPDSIKGRYKHPDIKAEVIIETNKKCVYCECYVTHQYPGDIEHIIPKSVYPRLTFIWGNLSFACYWCNNHKRDAVDKVYKLLNPYNDNIDEHLRAFGPLVMHINSSKRGELTWREINLNRKDLIDRRMEAIKEIQNLIDKFNNEAAPALKSILKQEIIDFTLPDKEFSFYVKQYLQDQGII